MSTDIYVLCLSHNPHLFAEEESGQHLTDLPQLRADIAMREALVRAWVNDVRPDERFRYNTVRFLAQHPHCNLGIEDEYGDRYALTDVQCERFPHKDERPDSHSHGGRTWRFVGATCPLGLV